MKYVGPNNGSRAEGRRRKRDAERERERADTLYADDSASCL